MKNILIILTLLLSGCTADVIYPEYVKAAEDECKAINMPLEFFRVEESPNNTIIHIKCVGEYRKVIEFKDKIK